MSALRAGVVGGSGYAGSELLRYLLGHPHFTVAALTSREHAGRPVADVHPAFAGLVDLRFTPPGPALAEMDVVFTAVPPGESMGLVASLREARRDLPVIDLGADFRLAPDAFARTYGGPHTQPELLEHAVYGTPELGRERIARARLVANPGCFAQCVILALAPLAGRGAIAAPVQVAAITGSSGSGARPGPRTHHPERSESVSAYGVLGHRHVPEIEHALGTVRPVEVRLVTHSGPYSRGIFATLFVTLEDAALDANRLYAQFAGRNRFVRLREGSPNLLDVRGTNFCDLAVRQNGREVIVLAALDNLGKGAAGNALQCANLMFGLTEAAGLWYPPLTP
jgi:N-acetyl-gamma-glutamyl-phosphate reductase